MTSRERDEENQAEVKWAGTHHGNTELTANQPASFIGTFI